MRAEGLRLAGLYRAARAQLAGREVERPVLIVGCGRSGTTILGSALAQHPRITYLNEPRRLWARVFPETDIWSRRAAARGGRLALGPGDTDVDRSRALRRIFERQSEVHCGGTSCGSTLVEKLPANSFRIGFLREIFPDGRFIHIFRNGIEVATSIAKYAERDPWWGAGDYKWQQLARLASESSSTALLPALCQTDYHRGLLEWRLTTEALVSELSKLPTSAYLELSYATFVRDPALAIARLLRFAGVEENEAVTQFVSKNVARRSEAKSACPPTEIESLLGGALLPKSMDLAVTGLVSSKRS